MTNQGSLPDYLTNPSNPLHLHSSENPSLILVSPPLNGKNFHSWQRSMKMALRSKNKITFVDGTFKIPKSSDSTFAAWERCNMMVLSWIHHSIEPSIAKSIMWIDKAHEVWNDLNGRFSQTDVFKIGDLLEDIHRLNQGECTDHYERNRVIRFLKGLNDQFSHVRSQIMMMDPMPNLNKAFSLVIQQERQMNFESGSGTIMETKAYTANQQRPRNFNSTGFRGFKNKYASASVNAADVNSGKEIGTNDKAGTVTISQGEYQNLIDLFQQSKIESSNDNTEAHNAHIVQTTQGMAFNVGNGKISNNWIVDTGASDHMSSILSQFSSIKKIDPVTIMLPNGQKVTAQFSGTMIISNSLKLIDVLYVPVFRVNLISVA
ncbi:uncharacterized protein LOC133306403 [Gastrolobium bilobum]|uniref:uncharacterized protein LOC133306403 n=1 Tax=Gastrolobium bilobum TaxID=150636 RepID=UPI002AB0C590|nr:uncharacterized protein LOC133306403 [Gastrolobium bilobum]